MARAKLMQIILLFVGMGVFFFTYYSFFQKKPSKNINEKNLAIIENVREIKQIDKGEQIKEEENTTNLIENLTYENIDYEGNTFQINSKLTKTFIDKKNQNFMEVVSAKILLNDGRIIEIYSDKAIYNAINYNTKFTGNVIVLESENKINSDNLDFIFDENLVTIYNNVEYYGENKFLAADKIDIDLYKKEVEIYMLNENDNVTMSLKN